jgi:protein-S-isoprenylcysteine O-methyltransferase Ste14
MEHPATNTLAARLATVGRKLFRIRLLIGIGVALAGLEWISPTPFFQNQYRVVHACALLVVAMGLALRAWGAGSAGFHTRSAFIEAPRLATGGAFAHVRNPIYMGSICIGLGMSMLITDPKALLLAAFVFAILYFTIVPAEEAFLRQKFGAEYLDYCNAVPRLIPRLTPWRGRTKTRFQWQAVRGECNILLVLVIIYAVLTLERVSRHHGRSISG